MNNPNDGAECDAPVRCSERLGCWTKIALTTGPRSKLIVAQDDQWGYMAILDFGAMDLRIGGNGKTPEEALAALENNLIIKDRQGDYDHLPRDERGLVDTSLLSNT